MNKIKLGVLLVVSILVGFSFTTTTKITVKGSDTMVILSQKWAEVYMRKNPSVFVQVTGGGSGVGIAALINGSTMIANSSRPVEQEEVEKLKTKYKQNGIQIACAKDGLSVYLNKTNPVNELTIAQFAFIGK